VKRGSKLPKVRAFQKERSFPIRCSICCDEEMRGWINACFIETMKSGMPRPVGTRVHRELVAAFGKERCPWTDSSTRRHLRDHEPLWNDPRWNKFSVPKA